MPILVSFYDVEYIWQVVADFVSAINEGWLYQWNVQIADTVMEEIIAVFPTMPQTSSALALWLVKLDAIIAPYLERVNSGKEDARMRCRGIFLFPQRPFI